MPPTRRKSIMKGGASASTSPITTRSDQTESALPSPKEAVEATRSSSSSAASPSAKSVGKSQTRKALRLQCSLCSDYPDGFRSEHELRRHTNRIHKKTRKVWVTIDASPDQMFLADCKACQTGKKYNECYNAASHLRRMHFHPHKRGERKMSAAEARRGGKPGDLDPPMEALKSKWLREVDEVVGDAEEADEEEEEEAHEGEGDKEVTFKPVHTQTENNSRSKAPPTPTTPSSRPMAIESIIDKEDAA